MADTYNHLTFSVEECAALSSISIAMLRKEIKAGRLKVNRAERRFKSLSSDFIS